MKGRFATLAIAAGIAACSAPGRSVPDAAASGSVCGDGIVEVNEETVDAPFADEQCDDGPLNGTPQSHCTKQCRTVQLQAFPIHSFALGYRVSQAVIVGVNGRLGWAFLTPDEPGLHVRWRAGGPAFILQVHSPATAVAQFLVANGALAVWTEGPTGTDPAVHLYYAEFDDSLQPQIHELPYPFADGTTPWLLTLDDDSEVIVLDQTAGPSVELLAAVIDPTSPQVTLTSVRVAAPGAVRGSALPIWLYMRDQVLDPSQAHNYLRVVQFFDDTLTYVTLEVRLGMAVPSTPVLSEFARGSWPFHVTGGIPWTKDDYHACLSAESDASVFANAATYTHPSPLLVITDSGDLYQWQFDGRPVTSGEVGPTAWAHVAPHSLITHGYLPSSTANILEPDGQALLLADGDCTDPASVALEPFDPPISYPPWTSSGTCCGWNGVGAEMFIDDTEWTWW